MTTLLQKDQPKPNSIVKKIKVEGELDEGWEIIVHHETAILKWKGFESRMVIWTKIYRGI